MCTTLYCTKLSRVMQLSKTTDASFSKIRIYLNKGEPGQPPARVSLIPYAATRQPSAFRAYLPCSYYSEPFRLPDISNNVGPVKSFFQFFSAVFVFSWRTTPFTPRSGLVGLVHLSFDDHGSFRNLSVGFSPTQTSLRSNFNHDYLFKLPLQGAGCPIKSTVFYCTPCPVPSCPTYEPNSNDGE